MPLGRAGLATGGLTLALALTACGSNGARTGGPDAALRDPDGALDGETDGADGMADEGPTDADLDGGACPILQMPGNAPPNACTTCASARCCPVVTACFSGGVDAGSSFNADGGYSDCYLLFLCNVACIGLQNNGWSSCIHTCESDYPGALVPFTKVITCFDDPAICGADADQCQIANPDGGPGVWPWPGS